VGTLYTHAEVRNLEIDLAYYKQVFVLVRAELGKPLVVLDNRSLTLEEAGVCSGTLLRVRLEE
jgi:hypothetical protein